MFIDKEIRLIFQLYSFLAVKQRSKKNQQAPKSENDPKDEETPKKEPPTAQASVKAKPKSKGVKAAIKDSKLEDIVYSPGFKLRSKVNDTVKVAPGRILKQVQYSGLEPTVKLPWPVSICCDNTVQPIVATPSISSSSY